jgi:hypothetical protein
VIFNEAILLEDNTVNKIPAIISPPEARNIPHQGIVHVRKSASALSR